MIRKGTKVRMSTAFKRVMNEARGELYQGNRAHVKEFGNCTGICTGKTTYHGKTFEEVDVRWKPSGLRYSYFPKDLERVK